MHPCSACGSGRTSDRRKLGNCRDSDESQGDNGKVLALEAVDFVLRYRNRIKTIQRRLDEMEQLINSTGMYLTPETRNR